MKLKTILISASALVILFFVGIFYYASQKVNGDELRKFMISSLEGVFPQAKVDVGKVKLGFGSSLNLMVEGVSLVLAEKKEASQRDLFKIQKVEVEIPLWIMLGFEQSITVNLDGSLINLVQSKGKSNWAVAFQGDSNRTQSTSSDRTAMAPAFLANGKFNLKFTDTRLNYDLEDVQKGEVIIEYFRVNNLGLKNNAAYELKSDISLKFSKEIVNMELSLIGQFSPMEFIQAGTLKTTSILTVNKMHLPGRDISVPGFKSDIKLELAHTGEITAKLATTFNDKSHINALVKTRKEELSIENIELVFGLDELLTILKVDIPSLRAGDGRMELKGGIVLGSQFQPNLTFSLGPQVKYSYGNMLFSGDLKGKYKGRSLVVGTNLKGLGGSLYGDFFLDADIGKQPIVLSRLPPFKFSIMANDLVISSDMIQNILYSKSSEKVDEKEKAEQKIFLLPKGNIDFNLKNISLGGDSLSIAGGVRVDNRKLASKNIKVTTSDGGVNASFESRFYREGIKSQFALKLDNMNLKDVSSFYPKWMGTLDGISSGEVQGTLGNVNREFTYDANIRFKIQNGFWHGLNWTEYAKNVIDRLSSVPSLGSKLKGKKLKISNEFREISLRGVFTHDRWDFSRYSFIGNDLSFKGVNGRIYLPPAKKKSILPMDVDLKVFRSIMSKNFARNDLPLRLTGVGFVLKPDIPFVTKKLAKSHVKKRSKKLIQNLKKKVLENSDEKKIKSLLKGIL